MMRSFIFVLSISLLPLFSKAGIEVFDQITTSRSGNDLYVNVHLSVPCIGLRKTEVGLVTTGVKVMIKLSKNDSLFFIEKRQLNSPPFKDIMVANNASLIDLIKIPVSDEKHQINIEISDLNDTSNTYTLERSIQAKDLNDYTYLSDLVLTARDKSSENDSVLIGTVPYCLNFFPSSISSLSFSVEIYKSDPPEKAILKYYITNEKEQIIQKYYGYKKISTKTDQYIEAGFDISNLPTGNYYLKTVLVNDSNKIFASKKRFIQRLNKINSVNNEKTPFLPPFISLMTLDQIRKNLSYCVLIANNNEKASIESFKNATDLKLIQNYFFTFWQRRLETDLEEQWLKYKMKIDHVNSRYTNGQVEGYETDMGRIFIQYGKPTIVDKGESNNGISYEIWSYNSTLDGQGNVLFVFDNPFNIAGQFQLFHSNAFGEVQNNNWKTELLNNNDLNRINNSGILNDY